MTFRVLVPQQIAAEGVETLLRAGLEVVQPPDTELSTLQHHIKDCQAVLVRTVPMSPELLDAAPDLEVISRHGAGVDNIDIQYCGRRGIKITYAPESNTLAVAEHALMLILAVTKNLLISDAEVRRGNFAARNSCYGVELAGKTIGVIGLGRIGQLVAAKAAAGLGMNAVGFDPYADPSTLDPVITPVGLDQLLAEADVVSVHVPLTHSTRGMISTRQFSLMKQGSYFVNCSRGGVVNESALASAVRSGRLTAAGVDVFESEPLPADHALVQLPNVILTPHMAAHTAESMVRMAVHAAEGIIAVAQREKPRWPLNFPAVAPLKED